MKKLFFMLAFMLVGTFAFANSFEQNNLKKEAVPNQFELTINLGDLTSKSSKQIKSQIESFIMKNLASVSDELQCKVTAKGSIDVGFGSIEISVEVSGPCSEVKAKGGEIAQMILDEIKKHFE